MTTNHDENETSAHLKNITFADLMRPGHERNEKVTIVFGDTVRHIEKWGRKGMPRRLVCEGLLMAALSHIYADENPREWLSFFRHMAEEAQKHENDVRAGLLK